MGKNTKRIQRTRPKRLPFLREHTAIAIFGIVTVGLVFGFLLMRRINYVNRFSDKDFDAISQSAENVLRKTGATEIVKNETCSYQRPQVYANKRLYCRVELAAYVPYESDELALGRINTLLNEVDSLGRVSPGLSKILTNPRDTSDAMTVALDNHLPKTHCNIYIDSNERARRAVDFLPEKIGNDFIALVFECSGESREEYFPVTYRQG